MRSVAVTSKRTGRSSGTGTRVWEAEGTARIILEDSSSSPWSVVATRKAASWALRTMRGAGREGEGEEGHAGQGRKWGLGNGPELLRMEEMAPGAAPLGPDLEDTLWAHLIRVQHPGSERYTLSCPEPPTYSMEGGTWDPRSHVGLLWPLAG